MADVRLPLAELAAKSGGRGFRQRIEKGVLQRIMEADGGDLIGAGRCEGGDSGGTRRNGYRSVRLGRITEHKVGYLM